MLENLVIIPEEDALLEISQLFPVAKVIKSARLLLKKYPPKYIFPFFIV